MENGSIEILIFVSVRSDLVDELCPFAEYSRKQLASATAKINFKLFIVSDREITNRSKTNTKVTLLI